MPPPGPLFTRQPGDAVRLMVRTLLLGLGGDPALAPAPAALPADRELYLPPQRKARP